MPNKKFQILVTGITYMINFEYNIYIYILYALYLGYIRNGTSIIKISWPVCINKYILNYSKNIEYLRLPKFDQSDHLSTKKIIDAFNNKYFNDKHTGICTTNCIGDVLINTTYPIKKYNTTVIHYTIKINAAKSFILSLCHTSSLPPLIQFSKYRQYNYNGQIEACLTELQLSNKCIMHIIINNPLQQVLMRIDNKKICNLSVLNDQIYEKIEYIAFWCGCNEYIDWNIQNFWVDY